MTIDQEISTLRNRYIVLNNHRDSRYFDVINALVKGRNAATSPPEEHLWQLAIDQVYQ